MIPRRSALLTTAVVAGVIGLSACTPVPAPEPTPTPLFASEAEAFKAAERVFRDYVTAENALQGGDQSAKPELYLTGDALSRDIESKRASKANGTKVEGATKIARFTGESAGLANGAVRAAVCLDVSTTKILSSQGEDITPGSRPTLVSLDVRFLSVGIDLKIIAMSPGAVPCT
ncbi:hypothetical protein ACIPY5_07990 [Microbacterium sp. NPDC089698]|uniref:hypothetical protein n=1 Tax=Microbacterium sp. NPDC089698 TaxID=3364200 RepID=UPI00382EBC97